MSTQISAFANMGGLHQSQSASGVNPNVVALISQQNPTNHGQTPLQPPSDFELLSGRKSRVGLLKFFNILWFIDNSWISLHFFQKYLVVPDDN